MGRRCRLLFALALATVAAALVCASLPSLLPDGELRGVRGQGSALRYRCGGGRRQTGLRRGRLAVRGGHVPIYSEWNANKSAPLWRMEAPEISSVYQVYAGPSSCYQPVFSQWNGTVPQWKANVALFQPVERKEEIIVARPSKTQADIARMDRWPTWESAPNTFEWRYSICEVAYVVAGEAEIVPSDGRLPVKIKPGDVVTFPAGMECEWRVTKKFRKHYKFLPREAENPYIFPSTHQKFDKIPDRVQELQNTLNEIDNQGVVEENLKGANKVNLFYRGDDQDDKGGFKLNV